MKLVTTADARLSKRQKFEGRAKSRVEEANIAIRKVGKLANRNLYEWEEEEIAEYLEGLAEALQIAWLEFEKEILENKQEARLANGGRSPAQTSLERPQVLSKPPLVRKKAARRS